MASRQEDRPALHKAAYWLTLSVFSGTSLLAGQAASNKQGRKDFHGPARRSIDRAVDELFPVELQGVCMSVVVLVRVLLRTMERMELGWIWNREHGYHQAIARWGLPLAWQLPPACRQHEALGGYVPEGVMSGREGGLGWRAWRRGFGVWLRLAASGCSGRWREGR
ncbi:hypothetical protein F4780DRAFT_731201 [Xylariomycetidae sp. FL0641]|nr:hypothetical protein F4780DRAFT_731201 [Xylariomycetidae sp. FL0641]